MDTNTSENHQFFEALVEEVEAAELGKLFGKPCGKIDKKAFVAFFQDQMVFKIGREEINGLLEKYIGSQNWDPSGKNRPMKDWIQIPGEFKSEWRTLRDAAIAFME